MAVTYQKEAVNPLDVVNPFKELMGVAVDKDSVYIRAKDTMKAFLDTANMSDAEKAAQLHQTLAAMTASVTDTAMGHAVQIAKENRDGAYQLTALREDTLLKQQQRDNLTEEKQKIIKNKNLIDAQIQEMAVKRWQLQAEMEKDLGVSPDNLPSTTDVLKISSSALSDKGTKWEQMQQLKMSVYATLAKSYRESGVVTWSVDATTNKVNSITDLAPTTPGLTKRQEEVAIRQEKAFDDNKVQHAANSSANMIGLLLSSADAGALTAGDVGKWRAAIDYLNTSGVATVPINTVYGSIVILSSPATISIAGDNYVISGTTSNIPVGNSVTVTVETNTKTSTEATTIVASDNTWSVTLRTSMIDELDVDADATVKAMAVDRTAHARYDTNTVNVTA